MDWDLSHCIGIANSTWSVELITSDIHGPRTASCQRKTTVAVPGKQLRWVGRTCPKGACTTSLHGTTPDSLTRSWSVASDFKLLNARSEITEVQPGEVAAKLLRVLVH